MSIPRDNMSWISAFAEGWGFRDTRFCGGAASQGIKAKLGEGGGGDGACIQATGRGEGQDITSTHGWKKVRGMERRTQREWGSEGDLVAWGKMLWGNVFSPAWPTSRIVTSCLPMVSASCKHKKGERHKVRASSKMGSGTQS